MLTASQRSEFEELGFIRFAAFPTAAAADMQAAVWTELGRIHGVQREDQRSWPAGPAFGMHHIPEQPTFAAIGGTPMRTAVDDLLGSGAWDMPRRWGAFLITFPMIGRTWTVPYRVWHADFPFDLPADPLPGVKVFILLSDVFAEMGGTLVVAGSHRVIRRAIADLGVDNVTNIRQTRLRILNSHPYLRELCSRTNGGEKVRRFMEASDATDGTPLRVVELVGNAGDVVLTQPWLLHCAAPNCGTAPRFMRSVDIYRRELHPKVYRSCAVTAGRRHP